ncbi:AMP-binding protein [Mycolicibacterium sarraceniae]|uniref:AMP-binding protein n=1 Tax=Mycolicibacterium sarraceniae TaxID=1534348 RepID=UPI0013CFFAF8
MSDVRVLACADRMYTRSQVDALSAGLAATLARRGVQAGHRVALMSSNRPEFVFAVRAIWRLGASAVLISPSWKAGDVGRALEVAHVDRMHIVTPPSRILGVLNIATVLDTGAWMRLHRRFVLDTMPQHIQSDRITAEIAVAPIVLTIASHPELEKFDLPSLRYIMWCATPVTASVADEMTRRTGVGWISAYGTSEVPVIAAVTTTEDVGADELDALIADRLASDKRPRDIVFVPEIPRLPSGKALRRVLKEQYGRTSDQ